MKKIILLVAIFVMSCSQGKSKTVDEDNAKSDSDEKTADIEQTDKDTQTVDEKQDDIRDEQTEDEDAEIEDAEIEDLVDFDTVEADPDEHEVDDGFVDEDVLDEDLVDEDSVDEEIQPDEDVFLSGNEYYCDPVSGLMSNDGSKNSPWGSLADVFTAKKTFLAGDIIYLRSGAHGEPFMTGVNSDYVHIQGYPGDAPVIASIQMESSKYWSFKDVSFSSDGTGGLFTRNYMFSANTNAEYVKIENCQFYSALDSSSWSKSDWYSNAEDAVILRGDHIVFKENTIKNVYFALEISGDHALVSNNLIDNFGADAIRALSSHSEYIGNTVRDAYIEDYSVNHDDGIQMYDKDNVTSGIIEDVVFRNNKIYNFKDPITPQMVTDNLVGYSMQGIIITDGYAKNVVIENNLVVSDHYHGITLQGAQNCRIQNNTVVKTPQSQNPTLDAIPWIQCRKDKQNKQCSDTVLRNNISSKLTPWTYDDGTNITAENNLEPSVGIYNTYFVDYANFDYHLRSDSPAKDAGNNTDLSSYDIDGNPRQVGEKVDCGAYEFQ